MILSTPSFSFFFFNDTATTEIYTLSLHDALPISFFSASRYSSTTFDPGVQPNPPRACSNTDRKSTRLNSSHLVISYAVFCLKKKKKTYSSSQHLTRYSQNPLHTRLLARSAGVVHS